MISQRFFFGAAFVAAIPFITGCSHGVASSAAPQLAVGAARERTNASLAQTSVSSRPIATKNERYIYASVGSSEVQVISARRTPKLVDTITQGISFPLGITIDKSGTLYVANNGNATVTEYPAGQNTPSLTLTQGLAYPNDTAVDAAGNLWVANGINLLEYPPGSTSPSQTLTSGLSGVEGVAVNAQGDVYVVNMPGSGSPYVAVIPPGATAPVSTFGQQVLQYPIGITLGPRGRIYVGDFAQGAIYVFSPHGSHKLLNTITGDGIFMEPGGVTIDKKDTLYVGGGGNPSAEDILEFPDLDHGNVQPQSFFETGSGLYGVAADPTIEP